MAAVFASSVALTSHGQSFTWLDGFSPTGGVVTTPEGPAVIGMTTGDSPRAARWTTNGGIVLLGVPDLPPLGFSLHDISADGSVLVGTGSDSADMYRRSAYRWTAGTGFQELSRNIQETVMATPVRVSADGRVVVGFGASAAFRWEEQTGTVDIGARLNEGNAGPDNPFFLPQGLSADGSIIVGENRSSPLASGQAGRWTAATGLQTLDFGNAASDISADGSIIVGESFGQAFRWTDATGVVELGVLSEGDRSWAAGISGNGSLIYGYNESAENFALEPFVWTLESGMQRLVDRLTDELGEDNPLEGWRFTRITAVSADGRFVAGSAVDPNSDRSAAWLADLGFTPVPEPSTYGGIAAVALLGIAWMRRRRVIAAG